MKKLIFIAMAMLSAFAITNCTPDQQKELLAKIANQTLRGEGAPAPELGAIGNYYFDEKNSDLYGPKTAEGWGTPVSLKDFKGAKGDKGDPGANGTKIYTGEGKPSDEIGAIGDWYFDTKTKTFYGPKTDKGWGDKTADISGGQNSISSNAYELSPDKKRLLRWFDKNLTKIDMQADKQLSEIKSVDPAVFEDYTTLKEVVLPQGLENIGKEAFKGCISLKSIIIPNNVIEIGVEAFAECSSLATITLSNKLGTIGNYAFANCDSLKRIVLPNSVVKIGNGAFEHSKALETIEMSNNVISIGEYAFNECRSLKSITIPSSVIKIGKNIFHHSGLESITFEATTPPNLENLIDSIHEVSFRFNFTIYVPANSLNAYKSSWSWTGFTIKAKE